MAPLPKTHYLALMLNAQAYNLAFKFLALVCLVGVVIYMAAPSN